VLARARRLNADAAAAAVERFENASATMEAVDTIEGTSETEEEEEEDAAGRLMPEHVEAGPRHDQVVVDVRVSPDVEEERELFCRMPEL
jgi:hypothetical protein